MDAEDVVQGNSGFLQESLGVGRVTVGKYSHARQTLPRPFQGKKHGPVAAKTGGVNELPAVSRLERADPLSVIRQRTKRAF